MKNCLLYRLLLSAVLLSYFTLLNAQEVIIHTVKAGETLSRIAATYGISEEAILEANPNAKNLFFTGMKLTIPTISSSQESTLFELDHKSLPKVTTLNNNSNENIFEKELFIGASLNDYIGEDIKNAKVKMGFHAGLSGRLFFYKNIFAEVSLAISTKGFNIANKESSGKEWDFSGPNYENDIKTSMITYNIDIPINIGFNYNFKNDMNIRIKIGPYITYALGGESRTEGKMKYWTDIHSSETETIDNKTKLSDMDGFNRFGIGGDIGVSLNMKAFIISATYQHGFTKLVKDSKLYEQNILFSIGFNI